MHVRTRWLTLSLLCLTIAGRWATAADSAAPFLGSWALTIPGGAAGWLGVTEKDGHLAASVLWGGGSVLPVAEVKVEGEQLVFVRSRPQAKPGKPAVTETIYAKVAGDKLQLTLVKTRDGKQVGKDEFGGVHTPDPGPAPDLAKVQYGPAITLFNGRDLTGWKLTNPKAECGWSVKDGVLMNRPIQEPGKPHKAYGNLRTEQEFEDFNITLEVRTLPGSNSGVYLRGIYEVQVLESFGKPVDAHNMGAIYSRITPCVAAEKPAGVWQTMDITLVERHATVILNGTKIIDNQPILGCTGGALWSDPFRPGPIYLQGDHSSIDYQHIVLKPVTK